MLQIGGVGSGRFGIFHKLPGHFRGAAGGGWWAAWTGDSDNGQITALAGGADSSTGGWLVGGVGGQLTGDGNGRWMTAVVGRADSASVRNIWHFVGEAGDSDGDDRQMTHDSDNSWMTPWVPMSAITNSATDGTGSRANC